VRPARTPAVPEDHRLGELETRSEPGPPHAREDRVGVQFPLALREGYELFGRRDGLARTQDQLLPPPRLRLDDDDQVLIFRVENQSVTSWGVRTRT
jgi:hypothetical protein